MTDNLFSDALSFAGVLWVLHERTVLILGVFSLFVMSFACFLVRMSEGMLEIQYYGICCENGLIHCLI